jgi:hypothetical protein
MLGCNCENGLGNTGTPNCVPIQSVTSTLVMVPLFANDGSRNGIDLLAVLPVWDTLINEVDESKRWFPLPQFENVELPKADSKFEESASGRKSFLRTGVRSFSGELWAEDSSPTLLGKLENNRCVDFGVYIIDVNGNLVGSQEGNFLYPIPVDKASFDPRFMFATDGTTQKIMVAFDFKILFKESTMYMITPEEAGIDFNSLTGLIDVNFNFVSCGQTATVAKLDFDYGTAINKIKFLGGVPADFSILNNTTALPVVVLTAVEGPNGTYTITYASQTIGNSLTFKLNKTGFVGEGTDVVV